jgi:hypothetical protein
MLTAEVMLLPVTVAVESGVESGAGGWQRILCRDSKTHQPRPSSSSKPASPRRRSYERSLKSVPMPIAMLTSSAARCTLSRYGSSVGIEGIIAEARSAQCRATSARSPRAAIQEEHEFCKK